MREHDYMDFARHKAEHDQLSRQIAELQTRWKAGRDSSLNVEVAGFLKHWLLNHIQGSDRKLGDFLTSKGLDWPTLHGGPGRCAACRPSARGRGRGRAEGASRRARRCCDPSRG